MMFFYLYAVLVLGHDLLNPVLPLDKSVMDDIRPSASLLQSVMPACLATRRPLCVSRRRASVFMLLLMAGVERNPGPGLQYGLLNVRSAVNKAAPILDLLNSHNLDFGFFTETWFRRDDPHAITEDIAPAGCSTIHCFRDGRKKSRGGGISLVYKNNLKFQRFPLLFKPSTFECLPVFLNVKNVRTNFIAIYRPPPAPTSIFFNELSLLLDAFDHIPGNFCLLGDFNCPGTSSGHIDSRLVDFLNDRDLSQIVTAPTRLDNLLDLIIHPQLSNTGTGITSPHLVDVQFSDHRLIIHDLLTPTLPARVVTRTFRNLKNIDPARFESLLQASPCYTMSPTDPNTFATLIDQDVLTVLDTLAPLQTTTKRESSRGITDWHSSRSRSDKRECRRLERRYRRTGEQGDYRAWRKAGRTSIKSLSDARRDFFSAAVNDSLKCSRSKWLTIKHLLHTTKTAVFNTCLSAAMFSQFFNDKLSLISANIASRVVSLSLPFVPLPNAAPHFSFSPVSISQADTLLLSLSKSSPVDVIPVCLLKSCHITFATLLTRLASVSFASGKFPDLYKSSQISPLMKNPSLDAADLASYRPISNLRTMGKLLERLAQLQFRPHILSAPAFSPYQSAYRPFHSTETAALFITNNLMRSHAPSLLVSLDLSAAFDCVSHSILLNRLSQDFGFSGLPLSWLESYLTGRTQHVFWNGVRSSSSSVLMGVPQGSVLGPLLFCAYVSPVSRLLATFKLIHHSYADDTTLILSIDSTSALSALLETSTSALCNWFLFNGLQLNPAKSDVLLVATREKRKVLNLALDSGLTIAGSSVKLSSTSKILGLTFDAALSFDSHISEVCKSANYHLRALAHIRRFLSVSSANLIACSIVSSRLDYCNSSLTGLSSYNIHRLQTVQNRAARIVLGVGNRVCAEPLLRQLHWLPVNKRILYKTALLTFKTVSTQQPTYLSSFLIPHKPSRCLRSSNLNYLTVPRVSTALQSRAFSVSAPHLWNSLPASLRCLAAFPTVLSPSSFSTGASSLSALPSSSPCLFSLVPIPSDHLTAFKRNLKTYLFDSPLPLAT